MFLQKCFSRRLQIPFFQFSSDRYDLPYKFQGIQPVWTIKSDESINNWVTTMIDPNIEAGFKYAFKNLTEALGSSREDALEYLQENCEESLYYKFKSALEDIDQNNDKLILVEDPSIHEEVRFKKLVFHVGLKPEESVINKLQYKQMKFKEAFEVKMYPFRPQGAVLEVDMLVKIKSNLNLKKSTNQQEGQIHHVIFRTLSRGPFDDLTITSMFKLMYERADLTKVHNILFGKDFRWVIADIDQSLGQ